MRPRVLALLALAALWLAGGGSSGVGWSGVRVEAAAEGAYPIQHVIFGRTQLDLLTTGAWSPYVHEGDSFMLMSGNKEGAINCQALNYWASRLREVYPTAPLYAATSGLRNIQVGSACVDRTMFAGMILVYEPGFPNAPEFTWDHGGTAQVLAEARDALHLRGLEVWTKISGRAAGGRDHYGDWDYGLFGQILDGQIIQTQGSCRDRDGDANYTNARGEFNDALESIHEMYSSVGTTTPLAARVTTASAGANENSVPPHGAMQCALAAWAMPEVVHVTLRTAVDLESIELATTFYRVRENLLQSGVAAASSVGRTPEVGATDPDAFDPPLTIDQASR